MVLCSIAVLRDDDSKILSAAQIERLPGRERRRMATILPLEDAPRVDAFSTVFRRVFSRISELHASFPADGVLAVAVLDNERVADYLHIRLAGEPEFAIIGRHDLCD